MYNDAFEQIISSGAAACFSGGARENDNNPERPAPSFKGFLLPRWGFRQPGGCTYLCRQGRQGRDAPPITHDEKAFDKRHARGHEKTKALRDREQELEEARTSVAEELRRAKEMAKVEAYHVEMSKCALAAKECCIYF